MEEADLQQNNNITEAKHESQMSNRKQLSLDVKRKLVDDILSTLQEDSLPRGAQTKLAAKHGVHRCIVSRVYVDVMKQRQKVPLRLRTTKRKYAAALKVSHVTIHRLEKRGKLRVHTSTNHPALSDNHKVARLQWVLSHLTSATPTEDATFMDMSKVIHLDEKWFYLSPETRRFYLLPKEEDPYRFQQSKRFRIKVMSLVEK
ncbi:uncharacterized protein LOC110696752 [Chenopodium quinoa]|uniref:uncharacterized protein LOC110696752 n=1 Tax=Chenopodium quinoa TaxID=63459 RepID=UPI000B785939|nr:uncharacterized protein LOC110696752 [Chenopodium quinoa]